WIGDAPLLRVNTIHHTLALFPSPHPGVQHINHQVEDFDRAGAEIEKAGHPVRYGTKGECELRRVQQFLAFEDPTGNKIEIVVRPFHSGERYFPSRDAGITHFSHIGLRTSNAPRDEQFWTKLLNARVSDWIGDAPLLRVNTVHHTLALFPSPHPGVQHINHQVEDFDDVMRSYYFLREKGVRIVFGPGRHPSSSACFLYFEGPDRMVYEYSVGVKHILPEEESSYRPRQFPFAPESFCMWGSRPDIAEFRENKKDEGIKKAPLKTVA
ncbi:MAG TPA: VOC family protein, partial [Burkholderiales bacterium]|nr:VOC family protein [Burkholderiales bacterium]